MPESIITGIPVDPGAPKRGFELFLDRWNDLVNDDNIAHVVAILKIALKIWKIASKFIKMSGDQRKLNDGIVGAADEALRD